MHEYVHGIEKIAKTAKDAIETGDVSLLAQCMNDSQILFDRCAMPNCKSELTSPKLHQIMNDLFVRNESLAIKGVGSQGDGSAQILCENAAQQNKVSFVTSRVCIDVLFANLLFAEILRF
jgi:galactokinase